MDLHSFCLFEKSCHLHDYEGLHDLLRFNLNSQYTWWIVSVREPNWKRTISDEEEEGKSFFFSKRNLLSHIFSSCCILLHRHLYRDRLMSHYTEYLDKEDNLVKKTFWYIYFHFLNRCPEMKQKYLGINVFKRFFQPRFLLTHIFCQVFNFSENVKSM